MPRPLTCKGLPVHYVAAWSGERRPEPLVVPATDGIAFADGVGVNGNALGRDAAGVLWQQ